MYPCMHTCMHVCLFACVQVDMMYRYLCVSFLVCSPPYYVFLDMYPVRMYSFLLCMYVILSVCVFDFKYM
jgi:hypothetical protein